MLGKSKIDCLLVGQSPPPHHGQAVVTGMLFEYSWSKVTVSNLRMAYSDSIESVGKFSFSKVFHLIELVFKTWKVAYLQKPEVLYYLPSSPHKVPFIRDVIYLTLTRWMFPKTIFHYHAGGLVEFVDGMAWGRIVAEKVYGGADLSIELSDSGKSPSGYFKAERKKYIPNGIDIRYIADPHKKNGKFCVLYLGGLSEDKGIGNIISTAEMLKARGLEFEMQVVGGWSSTAYKDKIHRDLDDSSLGSVIRFEGVLTGEDKSLALSNADCFLFPSHYASESFPLVLIEAMGSGLPIITTNWRGIPNVLGDNGAGFLCDTHSPPQYAEKIELLMNDPELRKRMGAAGRARYEREFTKERFLERMESVFEDVVNSNPS